MVRAAAAAQESRPGPGEHPAEVDFEEGVKLGRDLPWGDAAGDDSRDGDGRVEPAPAPLGFAHRLLERAPGRGRRPLTRRHRPGRSRPPGSDPPGCRARTGAPGRRPTGRRRRRAIAGRQGGDGRGAYAACRARARATRTARVGHPFGRRPGLLAGRGAARRGPSRVCRPPRVQRGQQGGEEPAEQRRALGGGGAGRVAEHPVGADRRTPSRRSPGSSSVSGRVLPAAARPGRTRSGARASISEVSVRPAWASPGPAGSHARTSRASARSRRRPRRTAPALPPCVDTSSTRENVRAADRHSSTSSGPRPRSRSTGSPGSPRARRWRRRPAAARRARRAGRRQPGAERDGDVGVGGQRQVRAVLFGGADRYREQRPGRCQFPRLRPGERGQLGHGSPGSGPRVVRVITAAFAPWSSRAAPDTYVTLCHNQGRRRRPHGQYQ